MYESEKNYTNNPVKKSCKNDRYSRFMVGGGVYERCDTKKI
jgi:hypothetical protein